MSLYALSQSLFHDYKRCQHMFKLIHVDELIPTKGSAGIAAEAGTAFDAYCRHELERQTDLDKELTNRDGSNLTTQAIEVGRLIYEFYDLSGAMTHLKKMGVGYVGREKTVLFEHDDGRQTPVAGIPDIVLHNGDVWDWKTSGVLSVHGTSKPSRVKKKWVTTYWDPIGRIGGQHRWVKVTGNKGDVPLQNVDPRWAFQLCTYNFLLGKKPGMKMNGGIIAAHVSPDRGGELQVAFAHYQGFISEEFQHYVWNCFHDLWAAINEGVWTPPTYHKRKCNMYNRTCSVAHLCPAYQDGTKVTGTWLDEMK